MKYKILLYLLIILSSLTFLSCDKTSALSKLNQKINVLVNAVEKHQVENIANVLAQDFLTDKALNKPQFLFYIDYQFKRNKNISISILDKEVRFNEKNADVIFKVLLLGSNDWLPERGQIYNVTSRWKKEKGDWVISRLRWQKN
ncbi:MAG: hypothetical protein KAT06_09855 [Gammaproteobacteria bacterium]|nr:hypothetical protein [Gammaproteobacteria bacterium]